MKNEIFLEKYFAEKSNEKQLSLLKDYMLSLSPDDLKKFIMGPLDFFEKVLTDSKISTEKKQHILAHIDKMIFLLKGKGATSSSK